jgi:hypothetical protein
MLTSRAGMKVFKLNERIGLAYATNSGTPFRPRRY